jgi:hypothetical protein
MSINNWNSKKIIMEDTSKYIEEARGKKIEDPLRAKLMGMEDIRSLKGTMTPRYFATKVIRHLQSEYPELDIDDLTNDDIQNAINVVANISKPLATRGDIQITTRERGAAEKGLKKGDTGFETLQLNLGSDAVLSSQGEVGENDLYTVVKDGLKYRVTLNTFKGTKINLDDISQDDVVSVVVVKPSEVETVDKFGGEIELGQREKLVADYPEGEEDYDEDAEIDTEKADLNNDGKLSEYEKARGQAIADAIEKQEKDEDAESCDAEDEDAERCPVTGKLRKSSDEEVSQLTDEFYQHLRKGNNKEARDILVKLSTKDPEKFEELLNVFDDDDVQKEEEEEVKLSPNQVNQYLVNQYRQKMQTMHYNERLNRHGY